MSPLRMIAEATRKALVVWVALPGDRPRPLWHLWHDGAAYVVTGGLEQPLPGGESAGSGQVVVPGKGGVTQRILTWVATVERVAPGTPAWEEVVPLLHSKRLNAPDGEGQPGRWARESVVLRLVPTGELVPPTGDLDPVRPTGGA